MWLTLATEPGPTYPRADYYVRDRVLLTYFILYTYSFIVYFKARNIYIIEYLFPYYRTIILDNPTIKVKVI